MLNIRSLVLLGAALAIAGCTGGGPRADAILSADAAQKIESPEPEPFVLVDLGQNFAERIAATMPSLASYLPQAPAEPFVIGQADVLDVAIVSNNETGFVDFTQSAITPISTSALPRQQVAADGSVAVPELGRIRAAGRTVEDFETDLTAQLSGVLVNPTAIVQLVERQSATASIIGAVSAPGSYPINLSDRRILDIIGKAGGPTREAEDLIVSLSRSGHTSTARLSDVYARASLNVNVRKNDLISIEPNLTRVRILGGTGNNDMLEFEEVEVSLVDVLSEAGGLLNRRASRRGIFVYREAPAAQLATIGAELATFSGRATVPTVFRLDMREPTSLFTGQKFRMMDEDIVYVADNLNEEINAIFSATTTFVPAPVEYVRDANFGVPR